MKRFNLHWLGRWGNNLFQYAFARGYCERNGLELHTDPWVGEKIFEISHPRCVGDLPRMEEVDLRDGMGDISYRSYSQQQKCADYYSLEQIARWFRFRQREIYDRLYIHLPTSRETVAHRRRGDYVWDGSSYPLVSDKSYVECCNKFALNRMITWVSEEDAFRHPEFTGELSLVPDFVRMSHAFTLLRSNSSFSFWGAAIAQSIGARIFSPVVDGLKGGIEHDVEFIEGNSARLASFDFVTPIEIKERAA